MRWRQPTSSGLSRYGSPLLPQRSLLQIMHSMRAAHQLCKVLLWELVLGSAQEEGRRHVRGSALPCADQWQEQRAEVPLSTSAQHTQTSGQHRHGN